MHIFKKMFCSCYQRHYIFVEILWPNHVETCPQRVAGGEPGSAMGFEFKGTARTDGDPGVIF